LQKFIDALKDAGVSEEKEEDAAKAVTQYDGWGHSREIREQQRMPMHIPHTAAGFSLAAFGVLLPVHLPGA